MVESTVNERLQSLISSGNADLPVLPAVASQIMQLANDEDADAAQLAALITSDPVLAGQIMRLANSAAISSGASIQSLQQAIARLGMDAISDMALSVSVAGKLVIKHRAANDMIQQIWRESLATACWSKELARACRLNTEAAFLSGLLHQIGKALLLHLLLQCLDDDPFPDASVLEALSNQHFVTLNSELAVAWSMPELVKQVMMSIACIEETQISHEDKVVADTLQLVKAAKLLATLYCQDATDNEDELTFDNITQHEVFAALNLYAEDLDGLAKKQESISGKVEAMLI